MSGRILLALLLPIAAIAIVVGLVRLVTAPSLDRDAAQVRRRTTGVTVLCFGLVILFALYSPLPAQEDNRLATLPAVAGLVGVVAAGWSERLWRRPAGQTRVASLSIREHADLPDDRGLRRRHVLGLVLSGALVLLGGFTAAADGRSVERTWSLGSVGHGPYPGWAYGLPIGIALALLAAGTWWALRRVDGRPVIDVNRPELDRAVRIGSRVRILRFAATGSVLTAAGLALTAGTALASLAQSLRMGLPGAPAGRAPWDWTQNAGFALIALAVVCIVVGIQSLLWDSPAIPRASRRDAAGPASLGGLGSE